MKNGTLLMMNKRDSLGYGYLYNWFTIDGNSTNLITDLHVPSESEWGTMTTYLGGDSVAGGKLKETGYVHWFPDNVGATDTYNFTAIPSGTRNQLDGNFVNINTITTIWTSTENTSLLAKAYTLFGDRVNITKFSVNEKPYGSSIRC